MAVYQAFKDVWPGITALGLAMDDHHAALVTPAVPSQPETARADIIVGKRTVLDDTSANRCP